MTAGNLAAPWQRRWFIEITRDELRLVGPHFHFWHARRTAWFRGCGPYRVTLLCLLHKPDAEPGSVPWHWHRYFAVLLEE